MSYKGLFSRCVCFGGISSGRINLYKGEEDTFNLVTGIWGRLSVPPSRGISIRNCKMLKVEEAPERLKMLDRGKGRQES